MSRAEPDTRIQSWQSLASGTNRSSLLMLCWENQINQICSVIDHTTHKDVSLYRLGSVQGSVREARSLWCLREKYHNTMWVGGKLCLFLSLSLSICIRGYRYHVRNACSCGWCPLCLSKSLLNSNICICKKLQPLKWCKLDSDLAVMDSHVLQWTLDFQQEHDWNPTSLRNGRSSLFYCAVYWLSHRCACRTEQNRDTRTRWTWDGHEMEGWNLTSDVFQDTWNIATPTRHKDDGCTMFWSRGQTEGCGQYCPLQSPSITGHYMNNNIFFKDSKWKEMISKRVVMTSRETQRWRPGCERFVIIERGRMRLAEVSQGYPGLAGVKIK